jgi:ElaB/YqjD/DUF883 family membrane-anchored ribosome-binding protein
MDEGARTEGAEPVMSETPTPESDRSPQEIRADIEETREEVGDTVEALAAKTDVKGQAQQRIADIKQNLHDKREELTAKAKSASPPAAQQGGQKLVATVQDNPTPYAIAGAAVAGLLIGRLIGRRGSGA